MLEGVRDGGGRLGGLLLVGGAELLVDFLGVEDAVDRGRPQALRAVQVQRGRVPSLHHEVADLDLAGAPLGDVPVVRGAAGRVAGFLKFWRGRGTVANTRERGGGQCQKRRGRTAKKVAVARGKNGGKHNRDEGRKI